jgi:aryl-alcohol dehydrogenase-like predicted oxidoreductase
MKRVQVGRSGPWVSRIGLGCMGMSEFYGQADQFGSVATLHRALELGVNFFDTADMYGLGRNEQLLRAAVVDSGKRAGTVIATKFGFVRDPSTGSIQGINGKPEYVKHACDESLRRLGVENIDLFYLHRVDPDVPIEETVGAMAELVQDGKVGFIALSEASARTVRRAHAVHPIAALQTEYSLWSRDVEAEILPTCRELGIALVAYSPLGRGFLTGTVKSLDGLAGNDFRRTVPRFQGENLNANLRILAAVEAIAAERGVTAAQVALAWLLAQAEDVIPIPGTKRCRFLEENVAATEVTLTEGDLARLRQLPVPTGERYSEAGMQRVNL